jgi:type II secretory pathway pseudopilin PulG
MNDRSVRGFTLLEVILVCIVGAILGVMLVQFVRTSSLYAIKPAIWFNTQTDLYAVMERITTEYRTLLENTDSEEFNLGLLKNYIDTDSEVSPYVSSDQTGFISFAPDGEKNYVASGISQSQGSNSILLVTLVKDGQSLRSVFVE